MCFIGIKVPHDVGRLLDQIDVPGEKESIDSYHVTLLYIGKSTPLATIGAAVVAAASVAESMTPFRVALSRRTSFPAGDDGVPVICAVDCPELHMLNAKVKAAFDEQGIEYNKKFPDYRPHVTLSYSPEKVEDQPMPRLDWTCYEMVLWGGDRGDDRLSVIFPFSFPKAIPVDNYLAKTAATYAK